MVACHLDADEYFNSKSSFYINKISSYQEENPFILVSWVVYNLLLEDIIAVNLWPGEQLIERKIAEVMQVSRSPIREAINRLIEDGYVSRKDTKGAYVAEYSQKQIDDLVTTRRILEGAAARIATETMRENEFNHLVMLANKTDSYRDSDLSEFAYYDNLFHNHIFTCARNEYLIQAYKSISGRINLMRNYFNCFARENLLEIIEKKEHVMLCKILELKNPDLSETFMNTHIDSLHKISLVNPYKLKNSKKADRTCPA